jgi:glycosyltransferase involved in cell wall biosynthesis
MKQRSPIAKKKTAHKMKKKHTIVCLSSQSWDDVMWTNKQHIMSRLAADHRVIHVDYGLRPFAWYLRRRLRSHPLDALKPWRLLDGVRHRDGNLYTSDAYTPLVAGAFRHGNRLRDYATFDMNVKMVLRHLEREGIDDPIIWVYHPGYGDALDRLPRKLLIYDCVDNYSAFPAYRDDPDWLMAREERLCRKADLVTATSQALFDSKRHMNPDNTYLVENVGDADHFMAALNPEMDLPADLAKIPQPRVVFIGAVSDYKLNSSWLLHIARSRPDWNVVVIGPVGMSDPGTDVGELSASPNVHLMGHRPYASLPSYLSGAQAAVIPYRVNDYTESVFPIKFFEFLASGTPVVISALPALEKFYDVVEVARNEDEFLVGCERALSDTDEEKRARRVALAETHSWPKRIGDIMTRIEERLAEDE